MNEREPTDDELNEIEDADPPLLIGDYDNELIEPWVTFLYGKWEKGLPESPGTYPVATLDGDVVGAREYTMRQGVVVDVVLGYKEPGWKGWRWSVSIPAPPKAPPAKE